MRKSRSLGVGRLEREDGWPTADAHQISHCVEITGYYLVVDVQHTGLARSGQSGAWRSRCLYTGLSNRKLARGLALVCDHWRAVERGSDADSVSCATSSRRPSLQSRARMLDLRISSSAVIQSSRALPSCLPRCS